MGPELKDVALKFAVTEHQAWQPSQEPYRICYEEK